MYRSDSVGKIILKVLLIVFLFACFFGVIIFWPNISNFINSFFEVEEVEQIKTNYYHVFEMNDMIYGMRDDGKVVKITGNAKIKFDSFDVDKGYLYYVDFDNMIHRVTLNNTLKDERYPFEIDGNYWDLDVNNDKAIVFGSKDNKWFLKSYSLVEFNKKDLSFESVDEEYFYADMYFFTDEKRRLSYYDFDDEKIYVVAHDASIETAKEDYIIYKVVRNNKTSYFLYNVFSKNSHLIYEAYLKYENTVTTFVMYEDVVYYIFDHTLNRYDINTNKSFKLLSLTSRVNEKYDYFPMKVDDNRLLIVTNCLDEEKCNYTYPYRYYYIKENMFVETDEYGDFFKKFTDVVYVK